MKRSLNYNILLFAIKAVSLLPFWFWYFISDCMYLIGCKIIGYRKKVVTENLKNAFPEKSDAEIAKIRNQFFRNLCDWLVENIKGQTIRERNLLRRVKVVEGLEIVENMIGSGKSVISMNAHFFNFDWTGIMKKRYPENSQMIPIYKPARNRVYTDIANRLRDRWGGTTVPMSDILPIVVKNHQQGILAVYYFFADQSPPKNTPFWTTFLNQETAFYLGGEKIATKFDFGVVYLDVFKPRRGHYEVSIKLISDNAKNTKEFDITRAYANFLDEHIRKHPENWLWSHRRWKHKRPENIELS